MYTDWFDISSGVRQGDSLSPTLFGLYINELAAEIKQLHVGVKLGGNEMSLLLYADDIVLMSESEDNLQKMINCLQEWCYKWTLMVNIEKNVCGSF